MSHTLVFRHVCLSILFTFTANFGLAESDVSSKKNEASAVQLLQENGDLRNAMLNHLKTLKIEQLQKDTANLKKMRSGFDGGSGTGGGSSKRIEPGTVQFLLENGDLKNAMLNYLKTLKIEQLKEDTADHKRVKRTFQTVLANEKIIKDIMTSNNYTFNQGCPPADSLDDSFACTNIGEMNGVINFEINKIADYYKELTTEELMIRLGSLGLHEHIHHCQDPRVSKPQNEYESYLISDYVKLTAKTVQVPLLKWTSPELTEQNKPLATVKYFDANDSQGKNGEFIKVTKSKDYLLSYEKCLNENTCNPISARKLNLVEAWTWGDHVSFENAFPYYVVGAALIPLGAGAGTALGVVGTSFISGVAYKLADSILWRIFIGSAATGASYTFYKMRSDLIKTSSPSYVAVQDNNFSDALILQTLPINQLVSEIKKFIDEAPHLNVSKEALKQWDESN